MVAPLLGMAISALPSIVKLFDSDDESTANKAAGIVSGLAQTITGTNSDDAAHKALLNDPEAYMKFQLELGRQTTDLFAEETKRLEAVNKTMRREYESSDPYVRRWRPTFGYVVSFSWAVMFLAVVYVIVAAPTAAPAVISALVGMTGLWGIALAVLGISVHSRSKDKAGSTNTSAKGFGILSGMADKVLGKGK